MSAMNNQIPQGTLRAVACAMLLALAGCASMAPDYERPAMPVQAVVSGDAESTDGVPADVLTPLQWRQVFLDPRLRQVIEQALADNRDLRVSLLNVEKARAQYRIQSADLLPSVQATANQSNARSANVSGNSVQPVTSRTSSLSVGFTSWELDLFGRIRSLRDEALQSYLALEQTERSARISLMAEVANGWLTVGAYQARLQLAQETLASQRKTLELTQSKHAFGVASAVDVSEVEASVESARADVASYTTTLESARHALDLVVGTHVPDAQLPQAGSIEQGVTLAPLPQLLSSSVLLQRPDVLAAEHDLRGAHANIGAARAAFFPTISLSASTGLGGKSLSGLFDANTRTWSFVPSVSLPIFNAGSLKASLDVAEIQKNIHVAQYEKSIQSAFSEVADALSVRSHMAELLDAQRATVAASQRRYALSDARWRNGVDSYLATLDAQRTLYSARQTLITQQLSDATNRVTLFKVLGGEH